MAKTLSEFEKAFAAARREQGSTGEFSYKNKRYNTLYKEEKEAMDAAKASKTPAATPTAAKTPAAKTPAATPTAAKTPAAKTPAATPTAATPTAATPTAGRDNSVGNPTPSSTSSTPSKTEKKTEKNSDFPSWLGAGAAAIAAYLMLKRFGVKPKERDVKKLLQGPPLMLSGPKATPTPPPTSKPKTPPSNPSAKGKPSSAKKPPQTKPEWMKGMSDKEIRDALGSPQPGPNRYAKGGWMKGLSERDVRSTLGLTERGTGAGKTAKNPSSAKKPKQTKPEWMKGMSDKEIRDALGSPQPGPNRYAKGGRLSDKKLMGCVDRISQMEAAARKKMMAPIRPAPTPRPKPTVVKRASGGLIGKPCGVGLATRGYGKAMKKGK